MKNIALIAALIGASSSAFVQAHDFGSSNNGRLHGYTVPFNRSVEAAAKGQYADAGQFGRIAAYGNEINKEHNVSSGVYANIGQYGRLGGYGTPEVVDNETTIATR